MLEEHDFHNQAALDVFHGKRSKPALKTLPVNLWKIAYRKFAFLNRARKLEHLRVPPSNALQPLKGDRKGQYSIRINDQYRICFIWLGDHATRIEITDYH